MKGDPKLEKRLGPFKEEAELSKSLVILRRDVPAEIKSIEDIKIENSDVSIKKYFESLGFNALIKRLEGEKDIKVFAEPPARPGKPKKKAQTPMF